MGEETEGARRIQPQPDEGEKDEEVDFGPGEVATVDRARRRYEAEIECVRERYANIECVWERVASRSAWQVERSIGDEQ